MQSNRKYHKSSLYYPDDKDLLDFLKAEKAPVTKLRAFLRKRGVFLARSATPEMHYKYISTLPLAWNDLVELVDLIDLEEKKESSTFIDYDFAGPITLVAEAFEGVRNLRSQREKEVYDVATVNGKVVVKVDYIDIDSSKTPMLQGRPATLLIELEHAEGGLRVTHTSNEVAKKILLNFQGILEASHVDQDGNKIPISSKTISLKHINDPELRVKFFTQFTRKVGGLVFDNTTNVKVARMPRLGGADVSDDADSKNGEVELDQKIKNVILQGVNLEDTTHYREFLQEGFYISSLSWESIDQTSNDKVCFFAGFAKSDEAEGLEYKVQYRQKLDEGKYQPREKVLPNVQQVYKASIQKSAILALSEVQKMVDERQTEPAPPDDV